MAINQLSHQPKWYHALTQNCTTTIRQHRAHIDRVGPWDWRILANGHLDELFYQTGGIDRSIPFEQLRQKSLINTQAALSATSDDFSLRIREGLPGMVK